MGRRSRARGLGKLRAPESEYRDAEGNVLALRGSMTPATRHRYASLQASGPQTTEDSWQRSVEFLFERLVVRWDIAGVPTDSQKLLLQRYRVASADERRWIRDVLREHLTAHFPDLAAP